jgi:3-isopropylmalate/(R)-2-methylmalate dehydratase small subunit
VSVDRIRELRGTALPLRGDDIDTDRIIPARFLKSVSFDGLEAHLFEDDRREMARAGGASHAVDNPAYAGAAIMVVGANFGCGSSREHAPQAIRRRGIRALIGQSFSEIFFGNSIALGMPCVTAPAAAIGSLQALVERDPATEITVDLNTLKATAGEQTFELSLPGAAREAFLNGTWDATGLLLEDFAQVRAVAEGLPYVTGAW